MFSTSTLKFREHIVVYPNLYGDINLSANYRIRVRVKKSYGATSSNPLWSNWSGYSVIARTPISYNFVKGNFIMASEFNNALGDVNRVRKTYGVPWPDYQGEAIPGVTIIKASQYSWVNMFTKVMETKEQVNNYGPFDNGRDAIKFDIEDKVLTYTDILRIVLLAFTITDAKLPNNKEYQIRGDIPSNLEGSIITTLPNGADGTHYVTAARDVPDESIENPTDADKLKIWTNLFDNWGDPTGQQYWAYKEGKNYMIYVHQDCDYLV